MTASPEQHVTEMLRSAYALRTDSARRTVEGTDTANFSAETSAGRVFVKAYRAGADLRGVEAVLRRADYAHNHGVPTPGLFRTTTGGLLGHTDSAGGDSYACSVWQHLEGEAASALTADQLVDVGAATGRLHRALAADGGFDGVGAVVAVPSLDLERARSDWSTILETEGPAPLDGQQCAWLEAVRDDHLALLAKAESLLSTHPAVTHQATHGDLASPNVLIHRGRFLAMIDFGPAGARPVTYDLARIGLDPRTVLATPDWQQSYRAFLAAYAHENPAARAADLWASARYGLIYLVRSTYPFRRLIAHGNDAGDSLWQYGRDRHAALMRMWPHLDVLERVLRHDYSVTRTSPPTSSRPAVNADR